MWSGIRNLAGQTYFLRFLIASALFLILILSLGPRSPFFSGVRAEDKSPEETSNSRASPDFEISIIATPGYLPKLEGEEGNDEEEDGDTFLVAARVSVSNPEKGKELRLKAYIRPVNGSNPASQIHTPDEGFIYPHSSWSRMPLLEQEENCYLYEVTLLLRLHIYTAYQNQLRHAAEGVLECSLKDVETDKSYKAEPQVLELLESREEPLNGTVGEEIGLNIQLNTTKHTLPEDLLQSLKTSADIMLENENGTLCYLPAAKIVEGKEGVSFSANCSLPVTALQGVLTRETRCSLTTGGALVFSGLVNFTETGEGIGGGLGLTTELEEDARESASLLMNEIFYDPENGGEEGFSILISSHSWVELYHQGFFIRKLDSLELRLDSGDCLQVENLTLAPEAHYLLLPGELLPGEEEELLRSYPKDQLILSSGPGFELSEEGGRLTLLEEGEPVDHLDYGLFDFCGDPLPLSSAGWCGPGLSLARVLKRAGTSQLAPGNPSPLARNLAITRPDVTATPFSTPDSTAGVLRSLLENASSSVEMVLYSLTSREAMELLAETASRGVEVSIILERHHASSWEEEKTALAAALLKKEGVEIRWSPLNAKEEYVFLHSKYLVVDETYLVLMSANLGQAGFAKNGKQGNREWGVLLNDPTAVFIFLQRFGSLWNEALSYQHYQSEEPQAPSPAGLSGPGEASVLPLVFREEEFLLFPAQDLSTLDTLSWERTAAAAGGGPGEQKSASFAESKVQPVFSPDSLDKLLKFVENAEESLLLEYMYFDSDWNDTIPENPLIPALKTAAAQGVQVRLLLDPRAEQYNTGTLLALEGSGVETALFNNGFFTGVHTKGMVADGEKVLVSSINLNHNSIMRNRETGLIIQDHEVAGFFERLFEFDWELAQKLQKKEPGNTDPFRENVLITRVYPDPYVKNDVSEFVELFNPGPEAVDLAGWYLSDLDAMMRFPRDSILKAGGTLRVARDSLALFREALLTADFHYLTTQEDTGEMPGRGMSLFPDGSYLPLGAVPSANCAFGELRFGNAGDELLLLDRNFRVVDALVFSEDTENVTYTGAGFFGPAAPFPAEGGLLVRNREPSGLHADTGAAGDWTSPRDPRIGQSDIESLELRTQAETTVFTLPEAGVGLIIQELLQAKESVYINIYQFTHHQLLPPLLNLLGNDVHVEILLEGFPMENIPEEEKYILSSLVAAGGKVAFMISDPEQNIHDRYQFDHAKYLIIDNKTLILLSENLKPSGLPTDPKEEKGNRGWGLVSRDPRVAGFFADVFCEDFDLKRQDILFFDPKNPNYGAPAQGFEITTVLSRKEKGLFEERMASLQMSSANFLLEFYTENSFPGVSKEGRLEIEEEHGLNCFVAPDGLGKFDDPILELIHSARESINVELLSCGQDWNYLGRERENLYLKALVEQAFYGVEVHIILDGRYSNFSQGDDNYDTFLELKGKIEETKGKLKVKLYAGDQFIKIHNKGMVVDRRRVLVSSVNWSPTGVYGNREAGIIIDSPEAGAFFNASFNEDWKNSMSPFVEQNDGKETSFLSSNLNELVLLLGVFVALGISKRRS